MIREAVATGRLGQCDLLAGQAQFGVFAPFLRISQNQARDVG